MENVCTNHANGFNHFAIDSLAPDFHLGVKFEMCESEDFVVDQRTGVRAWAEPSLVMYVSLTHPALPRQYTLRYALTRSDFNNPLSVSAIDQSTLQSRAEDRILTDTASLLDGQVPNAAVGVVTL